MYALYYCPGRANLAPHILLEDLGVSYELRLVDADKGEHKSPDYLKLNPSGLIPTLVDGDLVLSETAAICLHLADRHPDQNLAPAPGTPERAMLYRWLCYLTNTIQPTILNFHYAARYTDDPDGADAVKSAAERRLMDMYALVEAEIAGRAYFMGDDYTILDPFLFMVCRWARSFAHPPRDMSVLGPYLDRMSVRPSLVRAFEQEGIAPPFV